MAKLKRRRGGRHPGDLKRYDVMCGKKKVMEGYVYSRYRKTAKKGKSAVGDGGWCLQLWSDRGAVDEVICNFDSQDEAMDRLRREAREIHCSMTKNGE